MAGPRSRIMRHSRLRTSLVLALLLLAGTGMISVCQGGPSALSEAGSGIQTLRPHMVAPLKDTLIYLFQNQSSEGAYDVVRGDSLFIRYPLATTLSLMVYAEAHDVVFLSQSARSASRNFRYLFSHYDRDQDGIVELPHAPGREMEDVGFNTLIAIDMINLARMYMELKRPVEGLFWYHEAQMLIERLITTSYDPDANFFFPVDNKEWPRKHRFYALSLLPTLFDRHLGENIAGAMVRNYALKQQILLPESPCAFIARAPSRDAEVLPNVDSILKSMLLLTVLHHNGFADAEEQYRKQNLEVIRSTGRAEPHGTLPHPLTARVLIELLDTGGYRILYRPLTALDLFGALVAAKKAFDDPDIIRLLESINFIKNERYRDTSGKMADPSQITATAREFQASLRTVYFSVSKVKKQLSGPELLSPWKDETLFGASFQDVIGQLLNDVVTVLKRMEHEMSSEPLRNPGLHATCVLKDERLVVGKTLNLKTWVTTSKGSASIKSVILSGPHHRETLFTHSQGFTVHPLDTTLSFSRELAFLPERESGISTISFSLHVTLKSGEIRNYHFLKGIYVDKPLTYSLEFPAGRNLQHWNLPVIVNLYKKAPFNMAVRVGHFSPSGLYAREGKSIQHFMAAEEDTASFLFHVVVPDPCRPGSFPFFIQLMANEKDMGTVATTFFKHYQWTWLGPLQGGESALRKPYAPERSVNLLAGIASGGRMVSWKELPESAYRGDGELHLGGVLPEGGVGYLYTVIKSASDINCTLSFASTVPSALFLNGQRIIVLDDAAHMSHQQVVNIRRGLNNILIKTASRTSPRVYFELGGGSDIASDEFNNNLWEIIDGYQEFMARSVRSVGNTAVQQVVTLSYVDPTAYSVSVIGSFNGWSPEHSVMRKTSDDRWEITLLLAPGKYAYRFLVNNREQVLDPRCHYQESDGYGGENSVIFVD